MFFRRKKDAPAKEAREGPQPEPAPAPSDAVGPPPGAASSTQFLTGEAGRDRRTVQVLLEAIARVSEARDLESLLVDIVDSSIELTGAERGLLVMRGGAGADHVVRVARLRSKKPVVGDL